MTDHQGGYNKIIYRVMAYSGSSNTMWYNNVESATTYKPYGEIYQSDGGGVRYYTGKEWDVEPDLYYYNARYYDPDLGMFIQPDPAMQFPSPYLYVGGNPVNRTDPTGMSADDGDTDSIWNSFSNFWSNFMDESAAFFGDMGNISSGTSYAGTFNNYSSSSNISVSGQTIQPAYAEGQNLVNRVVGDFVAAGWGDVIRDVTGGIRYSTGRPWRMNESGQKVAKFGSHFIDPKTKQPTIAIYNWNFTNYYNNNSSSPYGSTGRIVAHELLHQMMPRLDEGEDFDLLSKIIYNSVYGPIRNTPYIINEGRKIIGY